MRDIINWLTSWRTGANGVPGWLPGWLNQNFMLASLGERWVHIVAGSVGEPLYKGLVVWNLRDLDVLEKLLREKRLEGFSFYISIPDYAMDNVNPELTPSKTLAHALDTNLGNHSNVFTGDYYHEVNAVLTRFFDFYGKNIWFFVGPEELSRRLKGGGFLNKPFFSQQTTREDLLPPH
jgi:hypothetical protein